MSAPADLSVASETPVVPEGQPAPEGAENATPAPAPEPPAPKRYKVKIDGQELEVDESELVSGYQTRKASQKAFQSAAEQRKQVEGLLTLIKTDPINGLKKLVGHPAIGHDLKKLATEFLAGELEREAMTPEQRELAQAREQLAAYEAEKKERETQAEAAETKKLQDQYRGQYEKAILEAHQAANLPATEYTFKRVTYYLREGLKREMELTPADVMPLVEEDLRREINQFTGGLPIDRLIAVLGPDAVEKLRKHGVEQFKQQTPAAEPPAEEGAIRSREKREKPAPTQTTSQFLASLKKRKWS